VTTFFSELKSDNVTVDKCHAGLVPNIGRQQIFNFFSSEKIRKAEKGTFFSL
jgi:hypothetical protein